MKGATIYTGSEKATTANRPGLAERENRADAAGGSDAGEGASDVADILQELTLRETRGFSSGFAGKLMGQLSPVMEMSSKPREAGFRVLRSPDVPSVLVELGYLSSKSDLEKLLSEEWRTKVTGSMAKAVDLFFAGRATLSRPTGAARRARRRPSPQFHHRTVSIRGLHERPPSAASPRGSGLGLDTSRAGLALVPSPSLKRAADERRTDTGCVSSCDSSLSCSRRAR